MAAEHPALALIRALPQEELPTVAQIDFILFTLTGPDRTSETDHLVDGLLDMRSGIEMLALARATTPAA